MSKFYFVLFACLLGFAPNALSFQDSLNPVEQIQTISVKLDSIEIEFENATHDKTLEAFDYGDLTIQWDSASAADKFYGIQYRQSGEQDWKQSEIVANGTAITVVNLPENEIFEFKFGSGPSAKMLEFETESRFLHTLSYTLFDNNSAEGKVEGVKFSWALQNNKLNELTTTFPESEFIIKYNTSIGAKQNKADHSVSKWTKIEGLSTDLVTCKLDSLVGGEKYVYKVGFHTNQGTVWSEKGEFKTKRSWGVFKTLILIGALGLFIFGMKIMSEGLQKAAGSRLRNMLASITKNRLKGILTGFGITSVVQSSSVTTVMTVSFVNAGLMTLKQSVGVLMGANIGTTLTAWLILFFGFKVDISAYALVLIAVGAPMLFFSKDSIKNWASVIIGFSLLFMGLGFLKQNVPDLDVESPLVQFFVDYKDSGILGTLMFVALGTLVTVVIQSSSAAMALTMALVAGNVLPFEVAAAMILGENIGTTITAQLAALIGNVHAKRAARIHALFNLIGVVWCIFVFQFFLEGIAYFMEGDPFNDSDAANMGIAIFHSAFNIANVLLLVWFVPKLVSLAERTVKSKGGADEEFHLDYIGAGIMGTPELSIYEAKKEVAKFGAITARMSTFTQQLLTEVNRKTKKNLHEKIAKYEEITDRVEIEVATYLAKVASGTMTEETASRIRSMNSIVNDLERIGDIFYQMSKAIERKDNDKVYFIPEQRKSLQEIFALVDKSLEVMVENLNADWGDASIEKAIEIENEINAKRDEMRKAHLKNLGSKEYNMGSGMVFNNLFSSCEKVGDHVINCSEALTGNID